MIDADTAVEHPEAAALADCATAVSTETDMAASLDALSQALASVRRHCPEIPVLAIRWMHVRHPLHDVQEALLRAQVTGERWQPTWCRRLAFLRRIGQCLAYAGYLSCRVVMLQLLMRRTLVALKRQSFALIARTWCVDSSRATDGRDFYYGDLQHRLAERGIRMLLVCGDALDGHALRFARRQSATGLAVITLLESAAIFAVALWASAHPTLAASYLFVL